VAAVSCGRFVLAAVPLRVPSEHRGDDPGTLGRRVLQAPAPARSCIGEKKRSAACPTHSHATEDDVWLWRPALSLRGPSGSPRMAQMGRGAMECGGLRLRFRSYPGVELVTGSLVLDAAGRRRSPATMPGFHVGRPPRKKGLRYPPDPPTVEEIVAVMRIASARLAARDDLRHLCGTREERAEEPDRAGAAQRTPAGCDHRDAG
jgi:hypothetical protein